MQLVCILSQFAANSHVYLIDHTYVGGCPEKKNGMHVICILPAIILGACCMHVNIHVHRELTHETFR